MLKGFNGTIQVEFVSYDGKIHHKSHMITFEQRQQPEYMDSGVKMYHGIHDDIINNFTPEPVYP